MNRKENLKSKGRLLDPIVRVGKNGLTDGIIEHVKLATKKRQLVKIKFLRSFVETNDADKATQKIAEETGAEVIDKVGFTILLYNHHIRPPTKVRTGGKK